jgi:hypothetical protein
MQRAKIFDRVAIEAIGNVKCAFILYAGDAPVLFSRATGCYFAGKDME